jgi:hypothetical protein
MYARIGSFLVALARFLIPFAGKSKSEKISNWIVGILILILGIGQALPYLQEGGDIVLPAPIEEIKPDIMDADPAPLIGKNGALLRYISMVRVAEAASCRPLVVDAGTRLAKCLAGLGVVGADMLVTQWASGEVVDASQVGWDLLPGLLDCAFKFGGYLVSSSLKTDYDSLGASMTPATKAAMALEVNPLAVCGTGEVPECLVIVPY